MDTEHKPLPVAGYKPQSESDIALANEGKQHEERYMRWLEKLAADHLTDKHMVAIAKTKLQEVGMWSVRSIFQPGRVKLPEDQE